MSIDTEAARCLVEASRAAALKEALNAIWMVAKPGQKLRAYHFAMAVEKLLKTQTLPPQEEA